MQKFEANGLGAFGAGSDSAAVWRSRVEAQDAFGAAAQAKARALQRKEEAMTAKRALLARLETTIHALTEAEAKSGAASELVRRAAEELESSLQVRIAVLCKCCHLVVFLMFMAHAVFSSIASIRFLQSMFSGGMQAAVEAQAAFERERKALSATVQDNGAPAAATAAAAELIVAAETVASTSAPEATSSKKEQHQHPASTAPSHLVSSEQALTGASSATPGTDADIVLKSTTDSTQTPGMPSPAAAPGSRTPALTFHTKSPAAAAQQVVSSPPASQDSPGSIENNPKRANSAASPSGEGLSGLFRSFSLKTAAAAPSHGVAVLGSHVGTGKSKSFAERSRRISSEAVISSSRGRVPERNALALMENGWYLSTC
jgi:hypothetical protein